MVRKIVKEWMTSPVISVSSSCTLPDAYWLMLNNKIHRLPVVDKGVLVVIVTLEDLHHMGPFNVAGFDVIHISNMLTRLPVRQIMTENPKTINPSAYLIDSARLMLKHEISALPVVDGNELLGIITKSDIFRAFVEIEEEK